jgi:hypothetical protein
MSEIVCITFKTHQTIIGEMIEQGDVGVLVKNPMQVIAVPPRSATDPGGVGFAPYLAFVEEFDRGINFNNDDINSQHTGV